MLVSAAATGAGEPPMRLRAAAQKADVVVLARCVDSHAHWDEDGRVITTDVRLEVERCLKGDVAATIEVRTLGGRVGRVGMGASHAASFVPGARVVALLRRSAYGSYFVVTSATAGLLAAVDSGGQTRVSIGAATVDIDDVARWLEVASP